MNSPLQSVVMDRVHAVLGRVLGFPAEFFTPDKRLSEEPGTDALDLIEIALELETEFGCEIGEEEMHQAATVGELCALIESKTEAADA